MLTQDTPSLLLHLRVLAHVTISKVSQTTLSDLALLFSQENTYNMCKGQDIEMVLFLSKVATR